MNFLKVAIMLKKQLRDTAQMERHLRVREYLIFRKMWLKKIKLCGKSLSKNQIIKHIHVMITSAQTGYNLTAIWKFCFRSLQFVEKLRIYF